MDDIKILVADDSEKTREVIKKIAEYEKGISVIAGVDNGEDAVSTALKLKPDVILMDINMPKLDGISATERITSKDPNIVVIMMSVQNDIEFLKKAMSAGAKEYILKPFTAEGIVDTVLTTYKKENKKVQDFEKQKELDEIREPKIISVFSTKGGVGKTFIATNLALTLSKITGKKVALLDANVYFGDIATFYNEKPVKTIIEFIEDISLINKENVSDYLINTKHNVDLLTAPIKAEYGDYVKPQNIKEVLNTLKKRYDYIICDMIAGFSELNISILDETNTILDITTAELSSIKTTKLGLDVISGLNYPASKIKMIINKESKKYKISKKDIEKVLETKIDFEIADEESEVIDSINKGQPICTQNKSSKLKKTFENIAKSIV